MSRHVLSTKGARHARPRYTPRHARPSQAPARVAAVSAAGGLLLPIGGVSAAHAEEQRTSTTRISGPGHPVQPGSVPVSVRLMSGGSYVHQAVVDIQVPEGAGWRTVTQATTGAYGLARTSIPVDRDTRVRAHYRGSADRTPATSASTVIDVEAFGQRVVAEASRHQGDPYRYGAVGPDAFDCSGFTRYVFGRFGKNLPHNARDQRSMAQPVSRSEMRVGDLIFLDSNGHVGIYAGNGQMWDSPRSGATVSLRRIYSSTYTVGRIA